MKTCQGTRGFTGRECGAIFTGEGHYCGSCRRRIRANNYSDAPGRFDDGTANPGARMFPEMHQVSAERKLERISADGHTYEVAASGRTGIAFFEHGIQYVPLRYRVERHGTAVSGQLVDRAVELIEGVTFQTA